MATDESEEENDATLSSPFQRLEEALMELEATIESNRQQAASNFARYELRPIEQAQIAWNAGLPYVNVKLIDLRVSAQAAGTADSYDREIHWTSTIARIAEIGWRLHTWCVEQKGDRLVALPLFERASGPTGLLSAGGASVSNGA